MEKLSLYIIAITMILLSALPCLADEYKGEIVKMTDSRIEIRLKDGGTESFQVTKTTRAFNRGDMFQVHHLLAHSKVRLSVKDGKVEFIHLEEVPK
jgi:hypothetical protein